MNEMFKDYMLTHGYVVNDDSSLSKEMLSYIQKNYDVKDDEDYLVKNKCTLFTKNISVLTSSYLYPSPKMSISLKGIKKIEEKGYKSCRIEYLDHHITLSVNEDVYNDLCLIIQYYENMREDADVFYKEKDYESALDLYIELYEVGYEDVLEHVASCYAYLKNIKKAIEIYTYRMEHFDDKERYYNKAKELFINKDYVNSYVYFKKANECGYTKSCFYIGRLYHYGFVFEKDLDKAKNYYLESLKHYNDERIHYHMAVLYRELKDYEKMNEHLLLSPIERIPYFKAKLYHKGIGVKKDLKKAKKYYEESLKYTKKSYYPLASVSLETRNYEDYFRYLMLAKEENDKRVYNHLGLAMKKAEV